MKLWSDSFRDGEAIPVDCAAAPIDVFLTAMAGHVLARATITGSYTLNPRLAGPSAPVST